MNELDRFLSPDFNAKVFLECQDNFAKTQHIKSHCVFRQENLQEDLIGDLIGDLHKNPMGENLVGDLQNHKNQNQESEIEFSIAIPTYKRIDTLKQAIDSALSQDIDNANASILSGGQSQKPNLKKSYEILVVENTDNYPKPSPTQELLESKYKNKITYYRNEQNLGLLGNFNRAITLAKGKWVCVLHDDDVLLPHYLSSMQKAIKQVALNTSLISHRAIYFGDLSLISYSPTKESSIKAFLKHYAKPLFLTLKTTKKFLFSCIVSPMLGIKRYKTLDTRDSDYICKYNPLHPSALLHHKDLTLKLGGYDAEFFPSDDWFFHTRAAKFSQVYQLNEFLSKYRYLNNASFNTNTLRLGSIVNFLHIRDNIKVSKKIKSILLTKQYQHILEIKDDALRVELLGYMQRLEFKPKKLNKLDEWLYKIYRLGDTELYEVESNI